MRTGGRQTDAHERHGDAHVQSICEARSGRQRGRARANSQRQRLGVERRGVARELARGGDERPIAQGAAVDVAEIGRGEAEAKRDPACAACERSLEEERTKAVTHTDRDAEFGIEPVGESTCRRIERHCGDFHLEQSDQSIAHGRGRFGIAGKVTGRNRAIDEQERQHPAQRFLRVRRMRRSKKQGENEGDRGQTRHITWPV
jgi:hypothetical protein